MQGTGHEFFAGAALTLDEDRTVGGGDEPQRLDDAVHLRAVTHNPLEAEFLIEPPAEFGIAANEAHSGRRLLHGGAQLADVERF